MVMKCSCGMKSMIKPKPGETIKQFLKRRKCSNCGIAGNWKILSKDEIV
ncbi:MAG: hypothetical protein ACPKQO_02215 [Nitrososphaeraceae archaeon]